MWAQVNPRHQQQAVVCVELRELSVTPVELPHAAAVLYGDVPIWTLRVPQLLTGRAGVRFVDN